MQNSAKLDAAYKKYEKLLKSITRTGFQLVMNQQMGTLDTHICYEQE